MYIQYQEKKTESGNSYYIEATDISYNQVLCIIKRKSGCNLSLLNEVLHNNFDLSKNGYKIVSLSSKNTDDSMVFYYFILEKIDNGKEIT